MNSAVLSEELLHKEYLGYQKMLQELFRENAPLPSSYEDLLVLLEQNTAMMGAVLHAQSLAVSSANSSGNRVVRLIKRIIQKGYALLWRDQSLFNSLVLTLAHQTAELNRRILLLEKSSRSGRGDSL